MWGDLGDLGRYDALIREQEYFDNAVLMVAMVKAGAELTWLGGVSEVSRKCLGSV